MVLSLLQPRENAVKQAVGAFIMEVDLTLFQHTRIGWGEFERVLIAGERVAIHFIRFCSV